MYESTRADASLELSLTDDIMTVLALSILIST
jgi:hypothetical protein